MPNTASPPDSKSYLHLCQNHRHNEDLQLLLIERITKADVCSREYVLSISRHE